MGIISRHAQGFLVYGPSSWVSIRLTPHPVIVAMRDHRDRLRVLL